MCTAKRIVILYGSQTYTSQEIAERIWRTTKILGLKGPVQALDDYPISKLIHEQYALFVCATTGEGEEPDNMKAFWKFLLRKNLPSNSLVNLKFGVIGLGDSSYDKFNFVAKKLHKRLMQLGAQPLLDTALCDYQHDLGHDAVLMSWLEEFYAKLNTPQKIDPNIGVTKFVPRWKTTIIKNNITMISEYGLNKDMYFGSTNTDHFVNPIYLEIESNTRTTHESHFQDVRLLSFKTVNKEKINYCPGDVFNIRPRNSKDDIEDLFGIFETHNIDIKPHYMLNIEEYHEGPEKSAVIGGFSGGANTLNSQDDEYRYAGVEDPKIMITTSREPSARLKMFVKELRLIFPNSQRMNRGGYEMSQLIHACRANDVTDFIVVHEHRGVPDSLVICHLPYGPTASFTLSGVVMRHDIPDIGPMSEQYPHLIFHNFKTDLDMPVPEFLKKPLPMYVIAEQYWDLKAFPTQYVFSLLALISDDRLERDKCRELSSAEGQEEWLSYCRRPKRTILEVLHDFHISASNLTIEVLFELFSTIKPRSFSIASSCLPAQGSKIELLLAIVKYQTKIKKQRLGLCSNWLKGLNIGDKVYGWIKKGVFKFPAANIPLILIGPGTGLAPFRNLIQERVALNIADKNIIHLFFGCRYRDGDFHCRDELEMWQKNNKISLYCAFSRDQEDKIYVQHKIVENKDKLHNLLINQGAYVFISGNSKNMPKNVKDAFVEHVLKGVENADSFMENMVNIGRFQTETW